MKGPAYQALRRRADLIVPLNLTDPRSPQFTEQNCRTMHDIMRYIHETSYAIVFQLGDLVTDRSSVSARLKAPIPLDLYVIDLFGGLRVDATRVVAVTPDDVTSVPFRALLRGMLHRELSAPQTRPVNLSGFFSVMSEQIVVQGRRRATSASATAATPSSRTSTSTSAPAWAITTAFSTATAGRPLPRTTSTSSSRAGQRTTPGATDGRA